MRGGLSFVFPVEIKGYSLQGTKIWSEFACFLVSIKGHDRMVGVEFDMCLMFRTRDGGSGLLPHHTTGFQPLENRCLINHNRVFPLGKREYQRYSRLIHDPFR